jgi:glutamine amidotransferase
MSVGIINMGSNNIKRFRIICEKCNYRVIIINDNDDYTEDIDKLIIPGIGSYYNRINYIYEKKLDKVILRHNELNKKILGICLGFQILSKDGFEGGYSKGLDIFGGSVIKFQNPFPHIGWNSIFIEPKNKSTYSFNSKDFYFVHSYYISEPENYDIIAYTFFHDKKFPSLLIKGNIIGTQFHPEKSGSIGVKFINDFLNNVI